MQDFMFHVDTQLWFGRTALDHLAESIRAYGSRVLMVYGGGSIKKNGLYDKITTILKNEDIDFRELAGVEPNPGMALVRKGRKMVEENQLDVVLAVGGGSVVDTAKAIAANVYYDGDVSEMVGMWWQDKVLPLLAVSTMSGAGTEMSTSTVLNNEETGVKKGFHGPLMRPRVTFLDPTNVFTASKRQTAAGAFDGINHVLESYLTNVKGAYLQARFGEAVLKTLFRYAPIAYQEPENYEARANVMLACTWANNGCITKGNYAGWAMHMMEHVLSGHDARIVHGEGLGVITPRYLRWLLDEEHTFRLYDMAVNACGIDSAGKTEREVAEEGICYLEDLLYNKLHMPRTLGELGVDESIVECMVQELSPMLEKKIVQDSVYKRISKEDIVEITRNCFH